ncbi:hypothetical protein CDAR_421671 [Caerostris darwini]|uniref:Uncharacterized protein n=1 Tax=Caerostris darwini TaxID=1538125 RepID=A0AAV4V0N3_9ARAC|nr:hypothetical protein CDAR_421671 [Caerostris darwini]
MCNSSFYGTKPAPLLTEKIHHPTPRGTGQKEQDLESSSSANCSSNQGLSQQIITNNMHATTPKATRGFYGTKPALILTEKIHHCFHPP